MITQPGHQRRWSVLVLLMLSLGANLSDAEIHRPPPSVSDELFTNDTTIRHLRLEISEKGLNTLRQNQQRRGGNAVQRPSVPAIVREGNTVYTNVAVHVKGSLGSFRPVDDKPGLTLRFDKFAPGQHFHGLNKISLNNSVQDPAYITDKLCREIYTQAGVPVPRADYATVELNGRRLGLYVLTEGWDKKFLKRYFANVAGNFYDPPPGNDINRSMQAASGEHPEDQSALKKLAAAATHRDISRRLEAIRQWVDLDRFLSLLALDVMTWNWDGYAMNKNNYRVFHDLESNRLVFMPHGMDQMFWKPNGPMVTGRTGLVARGLLQTEEGRRLYLERFEQLRSQVFQVSAITNRALELGARIRPAVAQDGILAALFHNSDPTILCQRIVQRARSIDEQLAGVKTMKRVGVNETVTLSNWTARPLAGAPVMDETPAVGWLHIKADKSAAGAWLKVVWLEEGAYTLEGRIKTAGVVASRRQPLIGAGLRVVSTRKLSSGVSWSWFPFLESGDRVHRGEVASTNCANTRLTGSTDWTEVTYEIELRQPLADLEVRCELYADQGEAWFDPKSLKLTRKTAMCP